MTKNMGTADRAIRTLIAVAIAVLYFTHQISGTVAILLGIVQAWKGDNDAALASFLKAAELDLPKDPPLKKEEEFRYIGKPMPRVDIPEKVAGKAIFGLDVNVPNMLYGSEVHKALEDYVRDGKPLAKNYEFIKPTLDELVVQLQGRALAVIPRMTEEVVAAVGDGLLLDVLTNRPSELWSTIRC